MNAELKKTGNTVKVIVNKIVYHSFNCESDNLQDVLNQLKREKDLYDLEDIFIEDFKITK